MVENTNPGKTERNLKQLKNDVEEKKMKLNIERGKVRLPDRTD